MKTSKILSVSEYSLPEKEVVNIEPDYISLNEGNVILRIETLKQYGFTKTVALLEHHQSVALLIVLN